MDSAEFFQPLKEELMPEFLKLFYKLETEGTCLNSFYEVSISTIQKPHKNSTKEICWPIFFINMLQKFLINTYKLNLKTHPKYPLSTVFNFLFSGMKSYIMYTTNVTQVQ